MIKETLWVGIVILGHRYSESTFDANNWSSWQIESDDNIQKILLILGWDALSRIHAPRKIIKSFRNFDHRPVWIFLDSFATLSWQARFAFLVKEDQFSGHPPPSYLIWLVEYDRKSCLIRLPRPSQPQRPETVEAIIIKTVGPHMCLSRFSVLRSWPMSYPWIRGISTIIHKNRNPTNPVRSPKANSRKYVPSRPLTILYFANTKSWSLNTKLQGEEITAASTWGRVIQYFSRASDSPVRSLLWLIIGRSLIKFLVPLSVPTWPIQSNLCSHSGRTPQSCPPPTCS